MSHIMAVQFSVEPYLMENVMALGIANEHKFAVWIGPRVNHVVRVNDGYFIAASVVER